MTWKSRTPPSAVARAAQAALDIRETLPPSRRGGTVSPALASSPTGNP